MQSIERWKSIMELAANDADIDRSKTLVGWHNRACLLKRVVDGFRRERDKDTLEASEKYKGDFLKEALAKINNTYQQIIDVAKDKMEADLQEVLDGKRQAWSRANSAPSSEAINLLTALQMRGKDLTDGEIMATIEKLNNNAVALRSLRSICDRAGITLPSFIGVDPDEFEHNMREAEQYARRSMESIGANPNELTYSQTLFWSLPGSGYDTVYFSPLDETTLTSEMIQRAQSGEDTGEE